jgi:hypothetical protein
MLLESGRTLKIHEIFYGMFKTFFGDDFGSDKEWGEGEMTHTHTV